MTDQPEQIVVVQEWSSEVLTEITAVLRAAAKRDKSEPFWKPLLLFLVAGVLIGAVMAYLDVGFPGGYIWVTVGAFFMLIVWMIVARQRMAAWLVGELAAPSRQGPVTLTLSSEGLRASHALSDTFFSWPAVVALHDGPLALHVMTTPTLSLPIQDRGLPTGIEREELRRRIGVWRAVP